MRDRQTVRGSDIHCQGGAWKVGRQPDTEVDDDIVSDGEVLAQPALAVPKLRPFEERAARSIWAAAAIKLNRGVRVLSSNVLANDIISCAICADIARV